MINKALEDGKYCKDEAEKRERILGYGLGFGGGAAVGVGVSVILMAAGPLGWSFLTVLALGAAGTAAGAMLACVIEEGFKIPLLKSELKKATKVTEDALTATKGLKDNLNMIYVAVYDEK